MKIAEVGYQILDEISKDEVVRDDYGDITCIHCPGWKELKKIERCARICYKTEGKITEDSEESAKNLISRLIVRGHEAMLEHSSLTVIFTVDRALSHELVRHRMASFAQESQRYCNYSNDKFEGHVTFIKPQWLKKDTHDYDIWEKSCLDAEKEYFDLLENNKPELARAVLPNCTKTELVITANYREWRHIFKLRTAPGAHPDMRKLMTELLLELKGRIPVIFDDIIGEEEANGC